MVFEQVHIELFVVFGQDESFEVFQQSKNKDKKNEVLEQQFIGPVFEEEVE